MALGLDRILRIGRAGLLISVATIALSACAANRTAGPVSADYAHLSGPQAHATVAQLASRYSAEPRNKSLGIHYAAALRASGQSGQAVTVMENLMAVYSGDAEVGLAYGRALAAHGRFQQALSVVDNAINPIAPDWEALSVKGAVLDQMGQHAQARQIYSQALTLAPNQSSLHANLGLSYAMTGELAQAETHLRQAVSMPGAASRVRQNLALVIGLQGRFADAQALYASELPPDEVEANMAYIRALLTQQNRWSTIRGDTQG